MNRHTTIVVSSMLLVLVVVGGVQFVDPTPDPAPKQVQFEAGPAEYTNDAIQRLDTVDLRMHYYSADSQPPTANPDFEAIVWSDVTDRESRHLVHPRAGNSLRMYRNVDGEWTAVENETWEYKTWAELSTDLGTPRDWYELPEESSAYSVERNTNDVVVVRVNRSVLTTHRNATALITIEKPSGNVRQVRQRTRKAGNDTSVTLIVYDQYHDVDVSRPDDAPYTLKTFLYDLKRGPIPFHRWTA